MKRTKFNHRQLAEDLAQAKNTPYVEIHCGSAWLQNPPRADVVNIRPSYTRFCIDIFEVKASRSDFLNSIRNDKWKSYLPHCHRLYFAMPSGLVKKHEIPENVGLIVRGDKGWTTVKGAKNREVEIPYMTILAFLFYRKKNLKHLARRYKMIRSYRETQKKLEKLGTKVKKAINYYNQNHDWKDRI